MPTATMQAATRKRIPQTYSIPAYRISLVRDSSLEYSARPQVRTSSDAAQVLHEYLSGVDREHFVVLLLDRKNTIVGINTVSIGSLTACIVHPREVFKPAIMMNAAAIICGHNHPSGNPQPSQDDRGLTTKLVAAGKLLGIDVLDHVVVGDTTHYSFADNGCL